MPKLDVFKNRVLEGFGLDFGGSGPGFWRVWPAPWDAFGVFFEGTDPEKDFFRVASLQASIWELQILAESQNVAKM